MIETMLQHKQIDRANMLDWLRHCEEQGKPSPTAEAIAGRFGYASTEAARTLLADLADRGEIRIDRDGSITISPVKPRRELGTERALPKTITRPKRARRPKLEISEDEGAVRIMEIIRRGAKPAPPKAEPRLQVVAPASTPVAAAPIAPAPKPASHQVNMKVSSEVYAIIRQLAEASDMPVATKACEILTRRVTGAKGVQLDRKPVVPVAVLIASIAAGKGLHEFVADLIERGLIAWQQERGSA